MENSASYNDRDFYDGDWEDNQQNGYDSAVNWGNDLNNEGSEDDDTNGSDDNHDPNEINLNEEDITGRNYTRKNRRNMAASIPSGNNSELDKDYWRLLAPHICPKVSTMSVAEKAAFK